MHFVSRLRRSRWPGRADFCPNYPVILHESWYRKKKLSDPLQKKQEEEEEEKRKKINNIQNKQQLKRLTIYRV